MNYPKKVMRKNELMDMGFPEEFLLRASVEKTDRIAWKVNPVKRNSPLLFDTEALEKWRLRQAEIYQKSVILEGQA